VIAEGIEDLDQAAWLLDHGCAMAQGYAFGRPAPLPSPTEILIGELNEALADDGAGDLSAEPAEPLTLPVQRTAAAPGFTDDADHPTGEFARTGELFDELADDLDD
jgi:hypothetical protein